MTSSSERQNSLMGKVLYVSGAMAMVAVAMYFFMDGKVVGGSTGIPESGVVEPSLPSDFQWSADWDQDRFLSVPRTTVSHFPTAEELKQIVATGLPALVSGSVAKEWASQDISDITAAKEEMPTARAQADDPVFVLRAQDGRFAPGPGLLDRAVVRPKEPPYTVSTRSVRTEDFFSPSSSNTSEYLYFTTPIELWQEPLREQIATKITIQEDDSMVPEMEDGDPLPWPEQVWGKFGLNMTDFFTVLFPDGTALNPSADGTKASKTSTPEPHATLWFAQKEVTAHFHHDRSTNFFIQLFGSKRVVLVPPTHHHDLQLYPSMHPSYRQSQHSPASVARVFGLGEDQPESLRRAADGAYMVTVNPGDVLYIPPFWFHCVTALDSSLSLSVVSPSAEEMAFGKAFWQALPLGKAGKSRQAKIIVVQLIFQRILSKLSTMPNAQTFVRRLVQSRYIPLFGSEEAFPRCALPPSFDCFQGDFALRQKWTHALGDSLDAATDAVVDSFLATRPGTTSPVLSSSALEVVLGDYIEEVGVWAVGACDVARFLSKCF